MKFSLSMAQIQPSNNAGYCSRKTWVTELLSTCCICVPEAIVLPCVGYGLHASNILSPFAAL